MNVYDFDNTIYDGESSLDFFLYCIKKNKQLIRFIPIVGWMLVKYKLCIIKTEELHKRVQKYAKNFLYMLNDIDGTVAEFWDCRMTKIKKFYQVNRKPDDLIISASCDFLLDDIMRRLHIEHYLCSEIDRKTGEIKRVCHGANKVQAFREHYGDAEIENFYTDSMNDKPLMELANQVYLIKGERMVRIR